MPYGTIEVDADFKQTLLMVLPNMLDMNSEADNFQASVSDFVLLAGGIGLADQYTRDGADQAKRIKIFRMALAVLVEAQDGRDKVECDKIMALVGAIETSIDALNQVDTVTVVPPQPITNKVVEVRKPPIDWLREYPIATRYLGYALLVAMVAVLGVAALPPAGFIAMGATAALVWKIVAPMLFAGYLVAFDSPIFDDTRAWSQRLDRHKYAFLFISSVLLAMALSLLIAPAMPAVLGGVMSAVTWDVLAALSFASMVVGAERLLHAYNHPPKDHWKSKLWYTGKVVLGVLLIAPALIFVMPGTMLAIAVKAGVSGVATATTALSSVTMQSIAIGAGITAAFMAGVEIVGALSVSISVSLKANKWNDLAIFFRWFGITQMVAGVVAPFAALHAIFSVAGNTMLHAARHISNGLAIGSQALIEGGRTTIQSASSTLPIVYEVFLKLFGLLLPPSMLGGAIATATVELEEEVSAHGLPVGITGEHAEVYREDHHGYGHAGSASVGEGDGQVGAPLAP